MGVPWDGHSVDDDTWKVSGVDCPEPGCVKPLGHEDDHFNSRSAHTCAKFLDGYKANFDTLSRAFAHGDAALLECKDRATGKLVAVVCAVQRDENGIVTLVPFAKMIDGNPYEQLDPPDADKGEQTMEKKKWTANDVAKVMANPVTCGIGPYPAMISDDEWFQVMTRAFKEKGVRPILRLMLENLREAFPAQDEAQPESGDNQE